MHVFFFQKGKLIQCKKYFQVASEKDVKNALDLAKEKFGRLDILVNCAGHAETHQVYNFYKDQECSIDGFKKCVDVS